MAASLEPTSTSILKDHVPQVSREGGKTCDSLITHVTSWLERAEYCFINQDIDTFVDLFSDNGYWRDILTIELDFNSLAKHAIRPYLNAHNLSLPYLKQFKVNRPDEVQKTEAGYIQSFIDFETDAYKGSGLLILIDSEKLPLGKALIFSTQIREVKGYEENIGIRRPLGTLQESTDQNAQLNWLEKRHQHSEQYKHGVSPTVLIIGGGQNGLMLAARLKVVGIDALIVEKTERIGDCWRSRYHSLCLHDPIWANHFPYMPYPPNWPVYIPKDKLANWFENYAECMELDVWLNSTVIPGAVYDQEQNTWAVDVCIADGSSIIRLQPRYLVLATGLNGEPKFPTNISSMEVYSGKLVHSSQFDSGLEWRGKRCVVVGACNSAHDVAADLWKNGASEVTMVQRSKTYVMSSKHGIPAILKGSYEEGGLATEDADLIFTSFPINVLERQHTKITESVSLLDNELLESLRTVGFNLDPYPSGMLLKYFRKGGGYYIDVGCSRLIAERKIQLKQGKEITTLTQDGVRFEDGDELKADIIVFATGYQPMIKTVRRVISDEVADRLGPVWGKDNQGEIPGVWRICGQPGFWMMCGNFFQARCFSKHVAIQIQLQEQKIYDKNWSGRADAKCSEETKA